MTAREPTVIAKTVTRIVVPFILVTAIALLLQGHNRPGGGFIAGVLTTTAAALTFIIYGLDYVQTELFDRRRPEGDREALVFVRDYGAVAGLGLAIAFAGGVAALVLGYPFLTQSVAFVHGLPLYGELEVASAIVFDLGVYVVVVGSLLTILAVVGAE
jgi:multicomponent Na+:H+ antiporter subunit B